MDSSFAAVRPKGQIVGRSEALSRVSRIILSGGLFLVLVCVVVSLGNSKPASVSLEERAGSEEEVPSSTDEVYSAIVPPDTHFAFAYGVYAHIDSGYDIDSGYIDSG